MRDSAKFFKTGSAGDMEVDRLHVGYRFGSVNRRRRFGNSRQLKDMEHTGRDNRTRAVTTTVNSNVTADQNAVASVNTTLDSLNAAVANAGKDYDKIYLIASIMLASVPPSRTVRQEPRPRRRRRSLPNQERPPLGRLRLVPGRLSVAFTPPIDGGAAISYTVVANDGTTSTGTVSPIIVTGLSNTKSYTFTVTATNSAGTGQASRCIGSS